MRKILIGIGLTGCMGAAVVSTPPSSPVAADSAPENPVLGSWRWNAKDGSCPELHEYRPDGTATIRSGGEVLEKNYTVQRYEGGPYFLFHGEVTASNGGKDCQGNSSTVGTQSGMFVLPTNDGGYYTCTSNEGWGCFGTASKS